MCVSLAVTLALSKYFVLQLAIMPCYVSHAAETASNTQIVGINPCSLSSALTSRAQRWGQECAASYPSPTFASSSAPHSIPLHAWQLRSFPGGLPRRQATLSRPLLQRRRRRKKQPERTKWQHVRMFVVRWKVIVQFKW